MLPFLLFHIAAYSFFTVALLPVSFAAPQPGKYGWLALGSSISLGYGQVASLHSQLLWVTTLLAAKSLSQLALATRSPLDLPFRKEVIQPHLPVRLPCYDFVPVIRPTLGSSLLAVESPTSGVSNSHDVTGGVYKARERIQRSMADLRLLATPASCRRVAAYNLNYEQL
jgi:hypothetical protein